MQRESRLSERLSQMQTALFKDITAAEKALHPLPMSDGAADEIIMPEQISIQRSARVQRSAAPPPPQPVFDDQELIELRKQVSLLSNKCGELEESTRSLSEVNQNLRGERDSMEAEIRGLKAEMERKDAQHKAELEDLRTHFAKVFQLLFVVYLKCADDTEYAITSSGTNGERRGTAKSAGSDGPA